jgi:hypothetical protein
MVSGLIESFSIPISQVSDDFMAERADLQQAEREAF